MMRYVKVAAAGLLLAAVATGCKGKAGEAETPAAADSVMQRNAAVLGPNDVAVAQRADLIAGVPISGSLEPGADVRVASPVAEVLTAVLVKEGQHVERGQVLAKLQTEALEPAYQSAEAQRKIAASDLKRMQNLFEAGAVSQKDVENAELSLKAAEANAAQARLRLEQATVRAPMPGVISERLVDAGARVKDGDHLFELVNTSQLEFAATVPAQYVGDIKVGAPVMLAVTGAEGQGVTGTVARINAAVDPSTRQVKVYVMVPNGAGKLVGGLFASGRIVLKQMKGALAIPVPGLRTDSDGKHYVLVVAGGRVARRDVTAGGTDEVRQLVEILAGLEAGDSAIIGPADGLRVGDPVSVVAREG